MKPARHVPVATATPPPAPIGRRAFLWTAAIAGLGALTGEWWARRRLPDALEFAPFPISGTAELAPGEALSFAIPGTTNAGMVVRLAADTYAAFDRRCPHLGCPVLWSAARARLECPCHAAVFNARDGSVLAGPPRHGLQPLVLERRGNKMWVRGPGLRITDPA